MIEIKGLTLIYKSGKGIFDVSFNVNDGEIFGYLGPNGAGKTTTIRGLLGQMNADKGTVRINNIDPRENPEVVNSMIGFLPGEIDFFDNYSSKEFLDYIANMRHLSNPEKRQSLLDRFELNYTGKIKKMSKGMKQKLAIVACFMHDPEIYILDEPTSGLDPLMQNKFLELLLEEKKRGKTILMSSHIFDEVERVCDRAGIIKDGKIIKIENFKDDKKKIHNLYKVTLKEDNDEILKTNLDIKKLKAKTYQIQVKDNYQEVFKTLSAFEVVNLTEEKLTIEDIFMRYYGGDAND